MLQTCDWRSTSQKFQTPLDIDVSSPLGLACKISKIEHTPYTHQIQNNNTLKQTLAYPKKHDHAEFFCKQIQVALVSISIRFHILNIQNKHQINQVQVASKTTRAASVLSRFVLPELLKPLEHVVNLPASQLIELYLKSGMQYISFLKTHVIYYQTYIHSYTF